jgi:protein tyrosine/serine phosphatase
MQQRILKFDGVTNFRDYGGYAALGGRRLHAGRLYRSAHHARASDDDLEAIGALGIAVVVDLRRKTERDAFPSRRHAAFGGQVIANDIGDASEDPWHAFIRGSDLSRQSFLDHALDFYGKAPFEPRHVDLYSRYFRALAEADGPVLIHCAAGKDRTGLLAALTHHLLGVAEADLLADYLLTNEAVDFERMIPEISAAMESQTGRRPTPDAVRQAMSVDAAYLDVAFAAIRAAHGSLDGYLAEALGVDAPLRERLEARLLA